MALPQGFTRWTADQKVAWLSSPEGLRHRDEVRASAMNVSVRRARDLRPGREASAS